MKNETWITRWNLTRSVQPNVQTSRRHLILENDCMKMFKSPERYSLHTVLQNTSYNSRCLRLTYTDTEFHADNIARRARHFFLRFFLSSRERLSRILWQRVYIVMQTRRELDLIAKRLLPPARDNTQYTWSISPLAPVGAQPVCPSSYFWEYSYGQIVCKTHSLLETIVISYLDDDSSSLLRREQNKIQQTLCNVTNGVLKSATVRYTPRWYNDYELIIPDIVT